MASKLRGKSSLSLNSKAALDVLAHPALTVLHQDGVQPGTSAAKPSQLSEPTSVPADLIRLSSLEELMSYDDQGDIEPDTATTTGSLESLKSRDHSLTLDQVSAHETKREMFCNSCQTGFLSREDQVEHYQLDWHRYNLKRKLKGLTHVDQEEFERVAGDLSSISGSESDSAHSGKEEEPRPSHACSGLAQTPFIYLTTQDKNGQHLYAVYRSVLTGEKRGVVEVEAIKNLKKEHVWIILMRSGGHFAGAVFKGHGVVAHKTFHRYTVRAKRGTAQSVRDNQSGGHGPKSAGASLRRYNEAALAQEIQELIESWDIHVREASAIFIRTPKYSKGVFVGGGRAPFSKDDPRLRSIPFITRRPTLSEVKRVQSQLACIYRVPLSVLQTREKKSPQLKTRSSPKLSTREEVVSVPVDRLVVSEEGVNEEMVEQVAMGNGKNSDEKVNKKKKRRKPAQPTEVIPDAIQALLRICKDPEDNTDLLNEQLQSMHLQPLTVATGTHDRSTESHDTCTRSHDNSSSQACEADEHSHAEVSDVVPSKSPEDSPLTPLNSLWGGNSVLHVAAASGNVSIVYSLLLHGGNPVVKNQSGKTPYLVSKDKAVRDSFRRFMASHPTAYDYDSAHIPSPLTEEMERERREKTNEKKKAQKRARKQREKELKSLREVEKISTTHEQKMTELSDRERRALAAERRLASQLPSSSAVVRAGQCSYCDKSLAGVVPFERLTYKYCSMACLKEHRHQLN